MTRNFSTALAALLLASAPALAEGDATKGATVFKKCMACHDATKAQNKVGPHMLGIVGRTVASIEGFTYSNGMKEFAKTAVTWDEAKLDTYLTDPRKAVPGTKMAMAPLKKPEDRADIIAYLKTLVAP